MSENKGKPFNHREMGISQFCDHTLRFTLIVLYEWGAPLRHKRKEATKKTIKRVTLNRS